MTRGLLGRLGRPTTAQGEHQLLQSVLANLRVLLNTRQGSSPACPDFGIPDLTDSLHSFPQGVRPIRQHLQEAIARYEPRLCDVTVRYVDLAEDGFAAHFQVTGQLVQGGGRGVKFSTRVTRGAQVLIDG